MEATEFVPYLEQNYEELKASCEQSGSLFEDDQFPASDESLVTFNQLPAGVQWKRPHEIVQNPQFIVDNGRTNANDIGQGAIGDCWFLAAIATVSNIPEFFEVVVPQDQSFEEGEYAGIFHFRFFRYGEWIDVVVDDYLPVDANNRLIYCRNKKCANEYWCSLVEKAYAKINNCYEFLISGQMSDAYIDMTAGVKEIISLRKVSEDEVGSRTEKDPEALWQFLRKVKKFNSLCGCSAQKENQSRVEGTGLVTGHAYSITKFSEISSSDQSYGGFNRFFKHDNSEAVRLVRVRNPWGNDKEWTGAWSDKSEEWSNISEEDKQRLGITFDSDGEFWMSFEDFREYFDFLEVVHVDLNAFFKRMEKQAYEWDHQQYYGEWTSDNAGGGDKDSESFWSNPQYVVNVDDSGRKNEILVSLMQVYSRENRAENKGKPAEKPIQMYLYRVNDDQVSSEDYENDGSAKFTADQVKYLSYTVASKVREAVGRFYLTAGTYIIVPCIQNAAEEGSYLLRIFTEIIE